MPGATLKIDTKNPLHQRLVNQLSGRIKMAESKHSGQVCKWQDAERVVNAYVHETADDAKRRVNRESGKPEYTTIQIPYSYALLMAAHTYWTSVFFARSPVHQFAGRHGETEMQIQALEAIISYQVDIGGMMAPYYLWTYDVGKYGVGILGTYWDDEVHYYSMMTKDPETGVPVYVTNPVNGYSGNKVYNVSPYDFLPDPRVPVGRFQEGEFLAVYRTISWNVLVAKESQGYYTNLDKIKRDNSAATRKGQEGFLTRPAGPELLGDFGDGDTKHPAWIGAYEVYIDLIPNEWDLGSMNMPEKWLFTITGDLTTIIQAQPLGLMHCKYPFDVWECEPEAYSLWGRGIPETVVPIQQTMDWLVNSHFFNVRAMANGRFIYDPSKLDASQLESGEPGWLMSLRPEAWGSVQSIDQIFKQVQMSDATAMHFNDFERMFQIGERVTGIGDQIMGALSGGRKTATEVRTSAGFGVNRLKTSSEYMSAAGMSQHAQKLIQHTQQFLQDPIKLRIVGDLINDAGPKFMQVDPSSILGQFDFVPVDGTLPVDRFAQATLWKDILTQLRGFPQLMAQYDMGKIFSWVGKLAGLKNMDQFRIQGPQVQVVPDQQLQQQAQMGNLIPFNPPGGAGSNVMAPPPQAGFGG